MDPAANETGRVVLERVCSACLAHNPLGDPHLRELPVYLPPGYDAGRARYPVVYVLAGFASWGARQLHREAFGLALDQRLNRLIAQGSIAPLIAVLPDCFTRYGGSQYVDSPATGRYETHLIQEIVPLVDRAFRTKAEPAQRAVLGKSSGGCGALTLAMRHPDVFGVAASHSGDLGFEHVFLPDFPPAMVALERRGGVAGFLEDFFAKSKRSATEFATLVVLAMAACYSPNPDAPQGFDLPFDATTGALLPKVWNRWLAWDPLRMAHTHADALRKVKVYLDCGRFDEHRLYAGARQLAAKLKAWGVEHFYEEFDDGHRGTDYRLDVSLPWVSRQFAADDDRG